MPYLDTLLLDIVKPFEVGKFQNRPFYRTPIPGWSFLEDNWGNHHESQTRVRVVMDHSDTLKDDGY
jgi:hypothetical protein